MTLVKVSGGIMNFLKPQTFVFTVFFHDYFQKKKIT